MMVIKLFFEYTLTGKLSKRIVLLRKLKRIDRVGCLQRFKLGRVSITQRHTLGTLFPTNLCRCFFEDSFSTTRYHLVYRRTIFAGVAQVIFIRNLHLVGFTNF